ncbi:MAG TPA: hypothetical protein VF374_03315 [Thermoplasmata archaeon]
MSGAEPLESGGRPADRKPLVVIAAVVVAVILIGAIILINQLSKDEFDSDLTLVFTSSESWDGFNGMCTSADGTVAWEDVAVRLSSESMNVTWSDLAQPTVAGPVSYTVLDCGEQALDSWTVTLLVWNYGTEEGLGLDDYLYFKFAPTPGTGDSFAAALLHKPSGESIAAFEYTVA